MSYRRSVKRKINKKKIILRFLPIIMLLIISFCVIKSANKINVNEQKIVQMQQLDEKLSIAENTEVKTYYVSANGTSTDGTDINNPMSLEEANKKIYYGNEKVLFKCGDTFYGTMNFDVQAQEDEMFYIGSYGEGEKPIISGANILTNRNAWQLEEEGVYKIDLSDYSNFEGIGKTYYGPYNIGFIANEQGNIFGNRKSSKEKLENENDFYCESNYLYIKSNLNPSDELGKIKFVPRNNLVRLSSNTILNGLNIQYTGAHGIMKNTSTVKNIYIHNCIIQNIGGSVQINSSFTRYGNAIEFGNQGENILVENCIMRNTYDAGFTFQGSAVVTGFRNIIARNNILINCTYPIEIFCRNDALGINGISIGISECSVTDNISINQGQCWGYNVRPDKNPAAELVVWNLPIDKTDLKVKNNTYFNSRNIRYYYPKGKMEDILKNNVEVDYNEFYVSPNTSLINETGNYQDKSILQEYNQDQNSTFRLLADQEISQISNPEILNSNNYEEIKQYYENLEEEFKYTDIKNEIINQYKEFATNNQTVINQINGVNSKISKIESDIETTTKETITENKLQELIDDTYSIGTDVVTVYTKQIITNQELIELIKRVNILGHAFDSIYSEFNISNNSNKEEIAINVQTIESKINSNLDLDILHLVELLNVSEEIKNKEITTYSDYKFCTLLNDWTTDILGIYIDQYIEENPVTITYSKTSLTNQDVTATLTTNATVEVTNNTNNKQYTFMKNGSFTFEYTIKGRTFTIEAKVNNIDKIAPKIEGIEEGKIYIEKITPKISDANLQKVELLLNGQALESYVANSEIKGEGLYQIVATDKAGNTATIDFQIIENKEDSYQIEESFIKNIDSNTKMIDFSQKLNLKQEYDIYRNDQKLENNGIVATGDVLKTKAGNTYTLIVAGDINKDGEVNIKDIVKMRKYLLERNNLDETELLAADANLDEKSITIKDLVRIRIIALTKDVT